MQQATSNKQQATSNKQQATSNKQQVKYHLRKLIFFISILIGASSTFAQEVEGLTAHGHSWGFYDMWNELNYNEANFERFREVLTSGEGGGGNEVSDEKRAEFCSWLAAHKPSACGTDPGQSAFTPDGCTNPIPGSGQWNTAFNSPCNGHDRCYSRMGANKGSCDGRFFGSMSDVCREKYAQGSSKMHTLCGVVSYAYYNAVSSPIGSYFFNAAQSGMGCVGWHAIRKRYCNG